MRRIRRLPPADRGDHVAAFQRQCRVRRRLHDQQAFLRTEVLAQLGIQSDEFQVAPRHTERELEVTHVGHVGHVGHAGHPGHHSDVRHPSQVFGDERGLLRVAPPTVLDLHRVARLELAGQLHEVGAGPRFVLVLRLEPCERRAVEPGDDVTDLEPGLRRRPPRRDALDLRAQLVHLGVGLGLHDDSDPAAVVVMQDEDARRARRAPRTLCGETRRPGGEHGRRDHDPGALHDQMLLRGFTAPRKRRE